MSAGFFELAIVICLAAGLGALARALRQPVILAYLATGAIIGSLQIFNFSQFDSFHVFADLGIMLLLFLVGLEINYASLRLVGRASILIGLAQVFVTFILGFFIGVLFHFSLVAAVYISIALTLSSTIIIVKLLSDKKDLNSLYGKLSIGILLVQDIFAILVLVVLSGAQTGQSVSPISVGLLIFKTVVLFAAIFWLGRKVLPKIFNLVAKSQELLFLVSMAWMFSLAVAVSRLGLSIEIGGFLAGLALANSSEHFQIASRIRPLRDFFILIFFVLLGSSAVVSDIGSLGWPIIGFSAFVLIGNPLIVMIVMGLMGYRRHTGFMTGVTLAQISEFSLILAVLGLKLGHINTKEAALITSVGVITIILSSYVIIHSESIYRKIGKYLRVFERRNIEAQKWESESYKKPVVIIGFHRTGQGIAKAFSKKDLLIIDFDPEIAEVLKNNGYDYLFGDAVDSEIFERGNLNQAKLLISTSPDLDDNLSLLSMFSGRKRRPKIVVRADNEKESEALYNKGADYVLIPHISSGHHLGKMIVLDPSLKSLKKLAL